MSDREYTINVDLTARNDTDRAFAEAAGNIGAYDKLLEEQAAKSDLVVKANRRLAQSHQDLAGRQSTIIEQYPKLLSAQADYGKAVDAQARAEANARKGDIQSLDNRSRAVQASIDAEKRLRAAVDETGSRQAANSSKSVAAIQRETAVRKEQERVVSELSAKTSQLSNATDARQVAKLKTDIDRLQESLVNLKVVNLDIARAADKAFSTARVNQTNAAQVRNNATMREYQKIINDIAKAEKARDETATRTARVTGSGPADPRLQEVRVRADVNVKAAQARLDEFRATERAHTLKIPVELDRTSIDKDRLQLEGLDILRQRGGAPGGTPPPKVGPGTSDPYGLTQLGKQTTQVQKNLTGLGQSFTHILGSLSPTLIQPMIVLLLGMVAGFASIASAAAAAGTAMSTVFLSSIGEAIPVMGLFGAAMQRLQNVMGLVSGMLAIQQQRFIAQYTAAYQNALGINQVTIAQHAYSDALYAVNMALYQTKVSELGLLSARQAATRQLQQLVFQEDNARLAAEASSLAVTDAQKALQQAIATGGDVQSAQLALAQAQASHHQSVIGAQQAITDAANGSLARQNISQSVVQAQQAVTQANRAVVDANLAAVEAKAAVIQAQQAQAGFNIATAAQLAYLRSQMTQTELSLSNNILKIFELFRGAHGILTPMTNAILAPFIGITNTIYTILHDPRVLDALQGLASGIGQTISEVSKVFTGNQGIQTFIGIVNAATQNMRPLALIITDIFKTMGSVITTAAPYVHQFAGYLSSLIGQFSGWATSNQGKNWLAKWFQEAFKSLEAFIKLGVSIGKLIAAIIGVGGGAASGISTLGELTKVINGVTDSINKHGKAWKDLQELWSAVLPTMKFVGEIIKSIGDAFLKISGTKEGQKSLKALGDIATKVLIPAFAQFAQNMGKVITAIGQFLTQHPQVASEMKDFLVIVLSATAAMKIFGALVSPVAKLVGLVASLAKFAKAFETAIKLTGLSKFFSDEKGGAGGGIQSAMEEGGVTAGKEIQTAMTEGGVSAGEEIRAAMAKGGVGGGGVGGTGNATSEATTVENDVEKVATGGVVATALKTGADILEKAGPVAIAYGGYEAAKASLAPAFQALFSSGPTTLSGAVKKQGGPQPGETERDYLAKLFGVAPPPDFNSNWTAQRYAAAMTQEGYSDFRNMVPQLEKLFTWLNSIGHFGQHGFVAFNEGGAVGGYGGGDVVSARLEPGEHVFTKEEVRGAGGHGVLFALRSLLGGGGQGGRGGYAQGGVVGTSVGITTQGVTGAQGTTLANTVQFIHEYITDWNNFVGQASLTTSSWTSNQQQAFASYFTNILNQLASFSIKFQNRSDAAWSTITDSTKTNLQKFYENYKDTYQKVAKDTQSIFTYMAHSANTDLKAFGGKPDNVKLGNLPTFAGGGWIGQQGERGKDAVHAVLGRGEAVLNYAHQRVVEPAMQKMYGWGLGDMFGKVRGAHAGNLSGGFAGGGFIAEPGTNFTFGQEPKIVTALRALGNYLHQFVYGISGYRSPMHSLEVGGYANDPHTKGQAADIGVGSASRASAMAVTNSVLAKFGLWRPFDLSGQDPNEVNHVQLLPSLGGPYEAGSVPGTAGAGVARLIAGAASGSLGALISSAASSIGNVAVKGSGVLASVLRHATSKVMKAAGKGDSGSGGATGKISASGVTPGSWLKVATQIAKKMGWGGADISAWEGVENIEDPAYSLTAQNPTSPAYGLAQGITGPKWYYGEGGNPNTIVGQLIAMANYMKGRYVNPIAALAHEHSHGWYAKGGFAGGAMPIIAHAGEWVVNKAQQSGLAQRVGTTVSGLKNSLGFTGGPHSFAGGGVVGQGSPGLANYSPTSSGSAGAYTTPTIGGDYSAAFYIPALQAYQQSQTIVAQVEKSSASFATGLKQFLTNWNLVGGDNGLFADATQAVSNFTNQQSAVVELASAGFKTTLAGLTMLMKNGPQTALEAARSTTRSMALVISQTNSLVGQYKDSLGSTNKQIAAMFTDGKKNSNFDASKYEQLVGARTQLIDGIQAQDQNLAQDYTTQIQNIQAQFQAQYTQVLRGTGTLTGGQFGSSLANGVTSLKNIGPTITSGIISTAQTIAQTFGNYGALVTGIDSSAITAAQQQRTDLQKAYNTAAKKAQSDPRWQSVADDLLSQLESATEAVAEAQAQALSDAITQVQNSQSLQQSAFQMATTISQAVAATASAVGFGNQSTAAAQAISLNAGNTTAMQAQLAQYNALLGTAQSQGNQGAIQQLTQAINDLQGQIAQSILATQQAITAYQQLSVSILSSASSSSSGLVQSATGIITTLGQITGSLNLPQQIAAYTQNASTLTQQGGSAVQSVLNTINGVGTNGQSAFGAAGGQANSYLAQAVNAFNQGPSTYAAWLATNAGGLANFQSALPSDEQTLFNGLIQALTDNTTSVVQNNLELQNLNATTNQQQFSSAAWTMFRTAIFSGIGTLLPQYAMSVPSLDVGGTLTSNGLIYGHKDETITPASVVKGKYGPQQVINNHNLNITEPTEVADPVHLSNKMAWMVNHSPNSR